MIWKEDLEISDEVDDHEAEERQPGHRHDEFFSQGRFKKSDREVHSVLS
jgi:hypothetical protein